MKGFRRIKTRAAWSRRKKMPNGMTAILEFWDACPGEPQDYGVAMALIPPGKWEEGVNGDLDWESTGDGSMDHLPFFTKALTDFIALNPGKVIAVGAANLRRERLYRVLLKRYGFEEYEYGIGYEGWAMVLHIPERSEDG